MNIEQLKNNLPEYAKDIKLNLSSVLSEAGSPNLTLKQIMLIAIACSHAIKNREVIAAITEEALQHLSLAEIDAAKAAAVIMAMNNVYYRFTHLVNDKDYATMPARLRMNIMANPGIDKMDFELASLAVSALNGCGMCMESHANALVKHEISKQAIQSAVRIAAVLNAASTALN